jgi:acyl-CoA oxidase
MSAIQGMLLLCFRISKLVEENQDDIGMISMAKAWITERGREVVRMGREVCGGNGLLHENYVIRALADMEATYTYEGTYDINVLIAGRQITGNAAFK